MQFAGINCFAVVAAAAGGFFFGFAWYTMLGRQWMAATGKPEETLKEGGMVRPLILSAICQLIMAYVLAGILGHLGATQMTVRGGLITGAFVWIGFVATSVAVNYAWQRARPMLTLIDGGHWLGVLLVQGAILGAIGI